MKKFSAMHGEIVTSQINLGPLLLRQSDESHAYPSIPFIAMSHFLSFEPLIIPVYARCLCLYAVLLSRHSHHDPLLTLTRSCMTTGGAGAGEGGGGEAQVPGQQPGEILILHPSSF